MLITGTDTYITALDADAYLDTQYTRLNPLRAMWSVLSVNDKEVYLRQAANRIDSLMLKGEKEASEQTMQFPRTRDGEKVGTPNAVKHAQAEEAISLLNKELGASGDLQMKSMQTMGAMKNIRYKRSEMGEIGTGAIAPTIAKKKLLESDRAIELMKSWTNGGFKL